MPSPFDVTEARYLASATELSQLPAPAFAEIAFAGRSNVGKSSLINSMVQRRKLVRTSSTPGCTRQLNLFHIELRGGAVLDLVDLPGYGYAKRSKSERKAWGPMIERFLVGRAGLRTVVTIVDVRRGLQPEEAQLMEFVAHIGAQNVLVATKLDKLAASKRKPALRKIQQTATEKVIGYSAETDEGREALWRHLLKLSGIVVQGPRDASAPPSAPAETTDRTGSSTKNP